MSFLTGEWRDVLMLTYAVDRALLEPLLPPGVELDLFQEKALASLVGFRFLNTRVKGIPVPGARQFEEVNLRFYVRGPTPDGVQPGVCFVKELVPNRLVAIGARKLYNEPYMHCGMRHRVLESPPGTIIAAEYWWYPPPHGRLCSIRGTLTGMAEVPGPGSLEQFMSQRYWGFVRGKRGGGRCYQVWHEHWKVQPVTEAVLDNEGTNVWGDAFAEALAAQPVGAIFTPGSAIAVGPHLPTY